MDYNYLILSGALEQGVDVVAQFILSMLLCIALSADSDLLCMPRGYFWGAQGAESPC